MLINYILLGIGVLCNVAGNIFAKRAADVLSTAGISVQSLVSNYQMFIGIALFGLSFVAYIVGLGKIQLHAAYPVFVSCSIILVTLASVILFHETMRPQNIAGIAVIVTGIALLVS